MNSGTPAAAAASRGDRLDGADLVVGGLDGEHGRCRPAGGADGDPPDVGRPAASTAAAGPARPACSTASARRPCAPRGRRRGRREQAEQAEVDGVRARGGERHLVGADVERLGDHRAGVVEQQPGVAAGAVQPARVGVPLVEGGEQRPRAPPGAAARTTRCRGSAAGHGVEIYPSDAGHPPVDSAATIRLVCR